MTRLALVTNALPPYRLPLIDRLAADYDLTVCCHDESAQEAAASLAGDLHARDRVRLEHLRRHADAVGVAAYSDVIVAGLSGRGFVVPTYIGARLRRRPFVLWASLWGTRATWRGRVSNLYARHLYRHADAVIAYGNHTKAFVASHRHRDWDVFVAPQAVDAGHFGRAVSNAEIGGFRERHQLPAGPLVLYSGRLVEEKGIHVLRAAWERVSLPATLVVAGSGPLKPELVAQRGVAVVGELSYSDMPVAYASCDMVVVPSVRSRDFLEPWALVCNEALHQGRPVIATDAVGAAAGGLVTDGETGLVVPAGDPGSLADAITRLLQNPGLAAELGDRGRQRVALHSIAAMAASFDAAIRAAQLSQMTRDLARSKARARPVPAHLRRPPYR